MQTSFMARLRVSEMEVAKRSGPPPGAQKARQSPVGPSSLFLRAPPGWNPVATCRSSNLLVIEKTKTLASRGVQSKLFSISIKVKWKKPRFRSPVSALPGLRSTTFRTEPNLEPYAVAACKACKACKACSMRYIVDALYSEALNENSNTESADRSGYQGSSTYRCCVRASEYRQFGRSTYSSALRAAGNT